MGLALHGSERGRQRTAHVRKSKTWIELDKAQVCEPPRGFSPNVNACVEPRERRRAEAALLGLLGFTEGWGYEHTEVSDLGEQFETPGEALIDAENVVERRLNRAGLRLSPKPPKRSVDGPGIGRGLRLK